MKIKIAAILVLAAGLAACGSDEGATQAPQVAAPKPQVAKPADPTAKMARAVPSAKSGASVELKYDVQGKPEAGKAVEVDLALIVGGLTDSMAVSVTATPGLEVLANATANFGTLKIGEVANHKVTVRADRADVVYLTVNATLYAVGISSTRSFAIPLIFTDAAGTTAVKAASESSAKTDATGQKIESMPAKESK